MRKIFFMSLLGYVIGIIAADLFCSKIILIPFILVAIVVTCIFLYGNLPCAGVFMSVFLVLGMTAYFNSDDIHSDNVKYINSHSENIIFKVTGNPSYGNDKITFSANAFEKDKNIAKLDITVVNDNDIYLKYGDLFRIDKFSVSIPDESLIKSYTNYAMYLKAHGISGSVYTKDTNLIYIGNSANNLIKLIYDFTDYSKETLYSLMPDDRGGFSVALITGDKSYLSDEAVYDIEASGLSHIVAVSGMHMNIFVMLIGMLFSRRRKRSYIAALLNIFLCIFMVIFTGGSYSVIRAALMVILANVGYFLGRGTYSLNSVLCVGGIIVFFNPFSVFDTSFILSFAATVSIILFADKADAFVERKLKIRNEFLKGIISVTLSAQIFVIPCIIAMKNTVNIYSLPSNILVSPVIPFLMVTVITVLTFSKAGIILNVIKYIPQLISGYVLKVSNIFSSLPYSELIISDFMFSVIVILSAVYLYIKYHLKMKIKRKTSVVCTVVILICFLIGIVFPINTYIDFINVGQGDCNLIRDRGANILIDSGGSKNIDSDFGDRVVGAYLRKSGIYCLDYVFITHFDTDHCQGFLSLIDKFKIKNIVVPKVTDNDDIHLYEMIIMKAKNKGINIIYAEYGDEFRINDDSYLRIVAPKIYNENSSNNNSLMILYSSQKVTTLFAGDYEREEEADIYDVDADILKVGHHGSSDSTSREFLDKVSPAISVISVGKNNIYSHPHKEVLDMLYDRGVKVFRTDYNGTITAQLKSGRINIKTVR